MISLICEKYGIKNYTINDDGSIDVNGDVYLSFKDLTELPLTFNKVTGYFNCYNNYLIDNYCDTEIGGGFYTSLKQDGLTEHNYNEWRKLYKRKKILDDIFNI